MSVHLPLLSDLQPVKHKFRPGDSVLVRISSHLTPGQYQNLERAVKKFTGEDVRVLIVDCTQVNILWKHFLTGAVDCLVDPSSAQSQSLELGVANLDCSVVDFKKDDTLHIFVPSITSELQKSLITARIQEWTGKDVEVIVVSLK